MSLDLILGPMFAGKTELLIRYIRRYTILGYTICTIKPNIDVRYTTKNELCSHNQETETCHMIPVDELETILDLPMYQSAKVIVIEEGQFFKDIASVVKRMLDHDRKHIYISALNGDSQRELFGDIYKLIPLCTHIEWLSALCKSCKDGTSAVYSKRKAKQDQQIHVASDDVYESVCLKHYLE